MFIIYDDAEKIIYPHRTINLLVRQGTHLADCHHVWIHDTFDVVIYDKHGHLTRYFGVKQMLFHRDFASVMSV